MDIGTIVGIVSGFSLIFASLAMGSTGIMGFYNLPSLLVVIGGTIAAILIMFPMKMVFGSIKVAMKVFTHRLHSPDSTAKTIVEMAQKVRKESMLALENEEFSDKFLGKGIRLCIDGSAPSTVTSILTRELSVLKERHKAGQDIFEQLGMLAPAFGMIGTLIGLVQMLATLSDPSSIGPAMAVALLTTFYGAVLANLVFLPIAKKLEVRSKEESLIKQLIIEGVSGLARRENPIALSEKLEVFLEPKMRTEKKS